MPCYQMCCPHGQAYLDNPDFDYYDDDSPFKICQDAKIGEYDPQIIENGRRVDGTRNEDFLLVAPEAKDSGNNVFKCDEKYGNWGEFFEIPQWVGIFNFLTDGRLEVNVKNVNSRFN